MNTIVPITFGMVYSYNGGQTKSGRKDDSRDRLTKANMSLFFLQRYAAVNKKVIMTPPWAIASRYVCNVV